MRWDGKWLLCDDTRVTVVQAVEPLWPSLLFVEKFRRKSKKGSVELAPVANADLLHRLPQFLQELVVEVCAGVLDSLQHE